MSNKRFVIEGEWLGYRSSQDHIVHVSVHAGTEKRLRAWAEKTFGITYTDGTRLALTVRDCKPRERVSERRSYMGLIRECANEDVSSVQELLDLERSRKAAKASVEVAHG